MTLHERIAEKKKYRSFFWTFSREGGKKERGDKTRCKTSHTQLKKKRKRALFALEWMEVAPSRLILRLLQTSASKERKTFIVTLARRPRRLRLFRPYHTRESWFMGFKLFSRSSGGWKVAQSNLPAKDEKIQSCEVGPKLRKIRIWKIQTVHSKPFIRSVCLVLP